MNNYLGSAAEGSGSDKSSIRRLCSSSGRIAERTDPGVKHLDYTKPPGGANELGFQISKMSGLVWERTGGIYFQYKSLLPVSKNLFGLFSNCI